MIAPASRELEARPVTAAVSGAAPSVSGIGGFYDLPECTAVPGHPGAKDLHQEAWVQTLPGPPLGKGEPSPGSHPPRTTRASTLYSNHAHRKSGVR